MRVFEGAIILAILFVIGGIVFVGTSGDPKDRPPGTYHNTLGANGGVALCFCPAPVPVPCGEVSPDG